MIDITKAGTLNRANHTGTQPIDTVEGLEQALDELNPQNNLEASAAPGVNDDSTAGYSPLSIWIFGGATYRCVDATPGAAVWIETGIAAEDLGSAAFASTSDFDPAGSAAAAQVFARQRANHTGTQGIETVSGLADALDERVVSGTVGDESVTTATGTQPVREALNQRQIVFNSVADMVAAEGLQAGARVRTLSYNPPNYASMTPYLGGNDYEIKLPEGLADGGSKVDLDNGSQAFGLFSDGKINAAQFGIVTELNNNPIIDQVVKIESVINFHLISGLPLLFNPGDYLMSSGIRIEDEAITVDIKCSVEGGRAVFHSTQAASNAGIRTFEFLCSETVTGLSLANNVSPLQKSIVLSSAASLTPGMLIEIRGTELWPYDVRDDKKGEIHKISRIEGNEVFIEDYTRDFYATSQIEDIVAWVPGRLSIDGIGVNTKVPDPLISTGGLVASGFDSPRIKNSLFSNQIFYGLFLTRNYQARTSNNYYIGIGKGVANGYGLSDRSGVGAIHENCYAFGCRRAYDAHASGWTPNRDWLVKNWNVYGGDGYYPDTTEDSWGLGAHGPSENGKFSGGTISKVKFGIIDRGKSTTIEGVSFLGEMGYCVTGRNGTGLSVVDCSYDCNQFPNKQAAEWSDIDTSKCPSAMVQINTPSLGGWDYSLPTKLKGNSAIGVVDHLFDFPSSEGPKNIVAEGNSCKAAPSAGVFSIIGHNVAISRSVFENNVADCENRDCSVFEKPGLVGVDDGGDSSYGVTIDGVLQAVVSDDSIVSIKGFSPGGTARPLVSVSTVAAGYTGRELRPESASGGTLFESGAWANTATPESLNGTFGVDGTITIGLTSNGTFVLENRSGSSRVMSINRLA